MKKNRVPKRSAKQSVVSASKALSQGVGTYLGQTLVSPLAAPVISMISSQLCDIADRQFSSLEAERAKSGITAAIDIFHERLNNGDKLRDDGFFTPRDEEVINSVRGRTKADKVFESMILTVKNDAEERKAKYIGKLFANLCFNKTVAPIHINSHIKTAGELSYNDLCYLYVFRNASLFEFPDVGTLSDFPAIVAKTEIFELMKLGFIASKKEGPQPTWFGCIDIRELQVQGYGFALYELMELEGFSALEAYEVMQPLGGKFKSPYFQQQVDRIGELEELVTLSDEQKIELDRLVANVNDSFSMCVKIAEDRVKEKRAASTRSES